MKQTDLVDAVSEVTGVSKKDTEAVLKALGSVTQSTLYAGEEITLPGIGKLSVSERAARTARNPRTGDEIAVPAKKAPKFSAIKALKDAVNA